MNIFGANIMDFKYWMIKISSNLLTDFLEFRNACQCMYCEGGGIPVEMVKN